MADNESYLLTRVLFRPDEMKDLDRAGFDPSLLKPNYHAAFNEIQEFVQRHKEMPSAKHLLNKGLKVVIHKTQPPRKATVYWEDIMWVRWHASLVGAVGAMASKFPNDDPKEDRSLDLNAITSAGIEHFTKIQSRFERAADRPRLLSEMMGDVEEEYKNEEAGRTTAIPIPFDFLAEELRGFKAGQMYVVAGRPKTGKSWFAMISAAHAIKNKYRVLLVSLEMRQIEMARRLACILGKISYNRVMKKTLNPDTRKKYMSLIRSLKAGEIGQTVQLVGPGVAKTPEAVDTLARAFRADMVIVDSFYVMEARNEKQEYWEKTQDLVRRYRRLSLSSDAAWMLVTQFNRQGGKGRGSARLEMLGFSDAIGQDANALIYIVRPTRLKKARQVDLVLGEAREADDQVAFRHFWDFREMNWGPVAAVEYGQDDEG